MLMVCSLLGCVDCAAAQSAPQTGAEAFILMDAGSGRVLVRPSGTEALMRVMVEAKTEETAQAAADRLAALIPGLVEC